MSSVQVDEMKERNAEEFCGGALDAQLEASQLRGHRKVGEIGG